MFAALFAVILFASGASGCVFGGLLTTYSISYELCDSADAPAYFIEGENNPNTYSVAARSIELASPVRSGYVFRGWSEDVDAQVGYTAIPPVTMGDLKLYALWEVAMPTGTTGDHADAYTWQGFLPYVDEFDAAYARGRKGTVIVESREELTAFCEYVQYKYLPEDIAPAVRLDYQYDRTTDREIGEVYSSSYFKSYVGLTWSVSGKTARMGIRYADYAAEEGKKTCADKNYFTQIMPYSYAENGSPHTFAIDGVTAELNCSTSNQLFYAALIGARPVPDAGSVAEEIYDRARAVLSDIVSEGMADYEITRAIYSWLVMNVTYDEDLIASNTSLPTAMEYDAFFLDGVFGSGRAVCDGISKAMTLLCRIEGVSCVRVTGADHAWNKVYVAGKWYVVDPTFGDTGTRINGKPYSFLTYRTFLVPESLDERYAAAENYTDSSYAATDDFGFYRYEFVGSGLKFNLYIESEREFDELYEWARSLRYGYAYSVDFYVTDASYVTKGSHTLDESGHYGTLLFNL